MNFVGSSEGDILQMGNSEEDVCIQLLGDMTRVGFWSGWKEEL